MSGGAVWVVITEERHGDVDADPFSTEEGARAYAGAVAGRFARDLDVAEVALTPPMITDGWVLLLEWGTEGDGVRVVRREMDATP